LDGLTNYSCHCRWDSGKILYSISQTCGPVYVRSILQ
jgi:hypothetical protein